MSTSNRPNSYPVLWHCSSILPAAPTVAPDLPTQGIEVRGADLLDMAGVHLGLLLAEGVVRQTLTIQLDAQAGSLGHRQKTLIVDHLAAFDHIALPLIVMRIEGV